MWRRVNAYCKLHMCVDSGIPQRYLSGFRYQHTLLWQ